jgi:divalent metal cation (Fe/Co/Zn/Cd) transporter
MEVYFWSFIVALMVFLVGGVLSMYEGVRQILNPAPVISPGISLTVLAVAAAFEGTSFRIAYREYRRVVRGRPTRLWAFIKASKDPALFAVLLEDSAALIGIGLASTGVIASGFFHIARADGAASVAVGLLLASVAWVLANETRSLIAGEAVAPIVMDRLKEALTRVDCITDLEEVATLHLGPGTYPCLPPRFPRPTWWRVQSVRLPTPFRRPTGGSPMSMCVRPISFTNQTI